MNRKAKKILLKTFLASILLSLFVISYLFLRSEPLLIKNIVITTDYDITASKELIQVLEKVKGQNIFLLNEKELVETLKSKDIKIKEISIKKDFPGKLLVNIEKRLALAVVPSGDNFFLVDREGLVFSEKKEANRLPVLNLGLQNISIGSRINSRESDKAILKILDLFKGKEEIVGIEVHAEEIQIRLGESSLVLLPIENEFESKLNALQTIIARLRIEGKRPSKIDLRFEKPVVTF